jgi:adenylosuccinate lyase
MRALGGEGRFRDMLAADEELAAILPRQEIDRCFDLDHALSHADAIIDRALRA